MKRLYVGCRVRLKFFWDGRPVSSGFTGRIISFGFWPKGHQPDGGFLGFDADCRVRWDDGNRREFTNADRLEPIVDDLNQVITWADMEGLWTPSGVEA